MKFIFTIYLFFSLPRSIWAVLVYSKVVLNARTNFDEVTFSSEKEVQEKCVAMEPTIPRVEKKIQ